jgi:hypothetical protein
MIEVERELMTAKSKRVVMACSTVDCFIAFVGASIQFQFVECMRRERYSPWDMKLGLLAIDGARDDDTPTK